MARIMTEKKLSENIEAFGKQDVDNAKLGKSLAIQAILFAAEHGRTDYISKFQSVVSKATSDAYSAFLGNVLKAFGVTYMQDGKEKVTLFFDYSRRESRFIIINEKSGASEARIEAAKKCRDNFKSLSESDFERIIFGRMDSRGEVNRQFMDTEGFDKRLNNLLLKAAKEGAATTGKLLQIARFIETDAFKLSEVELKEAATKLETDLKRKRDELEKLESQVAMRHQANDEPVMQVDDEAENVQAAA